MKKFEIPMMNISIFDADDVVTTQSAVAPPQEAVNAGAEFLTQTKNIAESNVFSFTF